MEGVTFVELYETPSAAATTSRWSLREVMINPSYIICMRPDDRAPRLLKEGVLPEGLNGSTRFTKVQMSRGNGGIDMTLVGDLSTIQGKINSQRKVLNG
ncbi:MAG TPA: hypothetical protein EYN67_04080 [Flavobacteriales bacterium]|jgi:hypothetical protein|nr:hypothetical protein [Flavobacteriales bacterium]